MALRKPEAGLEEAVTLVRIVVARKFAVGTRSASDFNHPIIAIKPAISRSN
jgi:hypothetical protein